MVLNDDSATRPAALGGWFAGPGGTVCDVSACYFSVSGPRKAQTSYC